MANEADIAAILNNHGVVRGRGTSTIEAGSSLLQRDPMCQVDALCWDATATINRAGNEILFQARPMGSVGVNAVMIGNQSGTAAAGQLMPPGFIYSDHFSGCLFYLFRDANGGIYGVHSYRSSGTFADPIPYFTRLGATLLYFFNTGDVFSALGAGTFGSVICNVSANDITIDFFAFRGDGNVVQVVNHTVINNWQAAPGIAAPGLGGALGAPVQNYVPPAPAQAGLKKRVASYVLKYI